MIRLAKMFVVLLVLCLLLASGAAGALWWEGKRFSMPGPLAAERLILIPQGTGASRIAELLERRGVIRDALWFKAGITLRGLQASLKAGEYQIPAGASAQDVARILASGKTFVRKVTVPEGLSSMAGVALLNAAVAMRGEIRDIPPEGTLLPDTYGYSHGFDRQRVLAQMQSAMRSALSEEWAKRAPNLPLTTPEDALILASIIEKETGIGDERSRVAGVFINRLRTGMKLQSDPTAIFGVTQGRFTMGRALTLKDLAVPSPYNTYIIPALPPAPICNPGRAAIHAALHPETHDYLYFVADGSGGHVFAATLEEHNRNVARWRALSRAR